MANTIRLKSGSGNDPSASDLVVGEVALRTDGNPKLFTKNDAGSVLEVGLDSLNEKLPLSGGTMTGMLVVSGTIPKIRLMDTNNNPDYELNDTNGVFNIRDNSNATNRFSIGTDGTVNVAGNLDVGAGIDVTGTTTTSKLSINSTTPTLEFNESDGNPDYRIFTESGAYTIQNLLSGTYTTVFKINSDGHTDIAGNLDCAAGIDVTGNITSTGDITLTNTQPKIVFNDSNNNPDYQIENVQGVFKIRDNTNSADRLVVNTDGHIDIANNVDFGSGIDVTGNITVTGTVDGVDIATRDTLFGGLTSSSGVLTNGVTATTQSAGDNSTKVATTAYTDTAISNLVDSSPSTLNTLNELAAALGDDANFSTTVTNSIATKLPLAGGTLTGNTTISSTGNPTFSIISTTQGGVPKIQLRDGYNRDNFISIDDNGDNLIIAVDEGSNGDASTIRHRIDGVEVGRITRAQSTSTITHALVGNVTTTGKINVNGTDTTKILGKVEIGNSLSRPSALDSDADAHCRIGGSDVHLYVASLSAGGGYKVAMQAARASDFSSFALNLQSNGGALQRGGNQVWDAGLDGAGSGLDADLLDGVQGSSYLRSDADDTLTGDLTLNGRLIANHGAAPATGANYFFSDDGSTTTIGTAATLRVANNGGNAAYSVFEAESGSGSIRLANDGSFYVTGASKFTNQIRVDITGTVDGIIGQAYSTYFGLKHSDQTLNSEYIIISKNFDTFISASSGYTVRIRNGGNDSTNELQVGNGVDALTWRANKIFHAGNDGAGSGLDADTLDGQNGSYYTNAANLTGTLPALDGSNLTGLTVNNANTLDNLDSTQFLRSDTNDVLGGVLSYHSNDARLQFRNTSYNAYLYIGGWDSGTNSNDISRIRNSNANLHLDSGANGDIYLNWYASNRSIYLGQAGQTIRAAGSNVVFHAGNDGSGSGLDADTLDGYQAVDLPFLRSDTTDAQTSGSMTFGRGTVDPDSFGASSGGFGGINDGSGWGATGVFVHGGGTGDAAAMAHNGAALYFGIQDGSSANSMQTWLQVTPGSRITNFTATNNANGVRIGGNKIFHAGNDGAGSGLDADTLDGISSGSFLRSDVNDASAPQRIEFKANDTNNWDTIATSTGSLGCIEIFNNGSGNDAFMAFHTGSDFAFYFGLDADTNKLAVGGWSMGANKYAIYHEGNNPTFSQLGITAANINALGINATTLDSIDSGSFIRSDTDDAIAYQHQIRYYSNSNIHSTSAYEASLEVYQGTAQSDAFMAFHVAGDFATYFGLDGGTNNLSVGGWSMGNASYKVWNQSNDGSGSGLDADTVDGLNPATNGNNARIVRTNSAGYIFANYFNTTADDTGTGSDCKFYASQDDYIRFIDLRSMRSVMNVSARSSAFSGREDQTSNQDYWIGSQGWGSSNFDTTVWDFGSCFFDTWSNPSGQPSGTSHWTGIQAMHYTNASSRYGMRITCGAGQPQLAYIQGRWNQTTYGWAKLWNDLNDGGGSGLDSDLLDGQHGSYYLNAGNLTGNLPNRIGLGTGVGNSPASRNAFLALGDNDTGVGQNGDGQLELWANNQEIVNIDTNGTVTYKRQQVNQASSTDLVLFLNAQSTGYVGDGLKFHGFRSATSANNFCAFDSGHAGSADREFTLRGDGNAFADGTWNNNGADYAEFFESSTGSAIPVGTTVVLENNKVRAATSSDAVGNIIGVVRPKAAGQASMTIGNTAWNKWHGKYLTDDFDCFILDDHNVIEWTDADGKLHSYESHTIPSDVTVPSNATISTHDSNGNKYTHYRLNPDFDSSKDYVPRHDRDEWVIIGLVGQVKTLKGQIVNDRWIKMRDVSDTVEEYFIR